MPTTDPDLLPHNRTAATELEAKKDKTAVELPQQYEVCEADTQSRVPYVAQPYVAGSNASELPTNGPRSELH